jgi:hypothetical protein
MNTGCTWDTTAPTSARTPDPPLAIPMPNGNTTCPDNCTPSSS